MSGAELRKIRRRLNRTQGEMARLMKISRGHYNAMERGKRRIIAEKASHVRAIASTTRRKRRKGRR